MRMIPKWNEIPCLRCVACVGSCPVGALRFTTNRRILVTEQCTGCGRCIKICPVGALSDGGGPDE
ncbi:MAG: 4Fe-4S dicluster domain-containing protein [Thermoplasmatota archaeon]